MTVESDALRYKLLTQAIREKSLPPNSGWMFLESGSRELLFPAPPRRQGANERFIITSVNGVLLVQIVQMFSQRLGYFTMDASGVLTNADSTFRKENKLIDDRGKVNPDAFLSQIESLISEIRRFRS